MKKILFVATGGTIACGQTAEGLSPELSSEQLLSYIPSVREWCEVDTVQPFSLDSTNMTPREWVAVAQLIQRSYDSYDGFVVAHGTDTMGYGAAALSCLIQNSRKPVVITGSQKPIDFPETDAVCNLTEAFRYATDDRAWGVNVEFCGRVIDGRCAVKVQTRRYDAFRSINAPERAIVSGDCVEIHHEEYSGEPRFYDRLDGRVAVVKLTPAMPAEMLDVQGVRALIIEGFGTGGLPDYGDGEYVRVVESVLERGVQVIMATQVLSGGSLVSLYSVGAAAQRFGLHETGMMTTEYAVMKAMWALAYSEDKESFGRLFNEPV